MTKRISDRTNSTSPARMVTGRLSQGVWGRIGATLACLSLMTSLSAPLAQAQVIKDPRAPIAFRPKIGRSANGTPLVDIVKPSFGGISHNKFQRYDIDTRGVILNNSKLGGTSIIGGRVSANPNLVNSRPARVILNEVTSTARSTLNGPTEVFGSRADVIVANPNGVGCVGCTFINSGRVTLSTGTPIPDYRRGTVDFDVERGRITISGAGLSSGRKKPLDAVDLVGRRIDIQGPVEAKDSVRLRAGGMRYDQAGDVITPKLAADLPAVTGPAIRSGSAGTIRAGTLSVVSRDVDLGVELDGHLESLSGEIAIRSFGDAKIASSFSKSDLSLTAEGQILLTGQNHALGRITAYGKHIEIGLEGDVLANDAVVMEALQSLTSRGILQAGNTVSLVSGGDLVAEGTIAANNEVLLEGRTLHTKDLEIGADQVSVTGIDEAQVDNTTLVAGKGSVKIAGQKVGLGAGTAFDAADRIVIDAKGDLTNGTILDYGNLDLSVHNTFTNAAGGQLVLDRILMSSANAIVNEGVLYGRISTRIEAGGLTNAETGVIFGTDLTLAVTGDLTNRGQIVSDQTLLATVDGVLSNDNLIQAGGGLTVTAGHYRADAAAAVLTGLTLDLTIAQSLENSGHILGDQRITLASATLKNHGSGAINAGVNTLTVAGDILNEGTIGGVSSLSVTSTNGQLDSPGSLLASQGDLTLKAASGKVTSGADLIAGGDLKVTAVSFESTAASRAGGAAITFDIGGGFTSRGLVSAIGTLTVDAGAVTVGPSITQTDAGTLVAKSIAITSAGNVSNDGIISATGDAAATDLTLTAAQVQNNGSIAADDELVLTAADYASGVQGQLGGQSVTVDLGNGSFDNLGLVSGQTLVDIKAGQLTNGPAGANATAGLILGKTIRLGTVAAPVATLSNDGSIEASADLAIQAGAITNTGTMLAETNGTLVAATVVNDGKIDAGETLTLDAASYTANSVNARISSKATTLGTDTRHIAIVNAGEILGSTSLTVKAASIDNRGVDSALGGGAAVVTTDRALTNGGKIVADTTLTLTAGGLVTNTGQVAAVADSLTFNANGGLENSGEVLATTTLTLNAPWVKNLTPTAKLGSDKVVATILGTLDNNGLFAATSALTLSAHDIVNGPVDLLGDGGVISGGKMTLTIGANLDNKGVLQTTNEGLVLHVPGTLSNSGTISANRKLELTLPNAFTNAGAVVAYTELAYSGSKYVGLAGSSLNAGTIGVTVSDFANAGSLEAVGDLTITSASIANYANANVKAFHVYLSGDGTLANTVENWGTISAEDYLSIKAIGNGGVTNAGTLESQNLIEIAASGTLANSGTIHSVGGLLVSELGGDLAVSNLSSGILQGKVVSIDINSDATNQGHIVSDEGVHISALNIQNRGASASNYALISGTNVELVAADQLNNNKYSEIRAEKFALIEADAISSGFLSNDTRDAGLFLFGGDLTVHIGQAYTFTKDLKVKGNLEFEAYYGIHNNFVVAADGDLTLESVSGKITNGNAAGTDQGTISAGGNLTLTAFKGIQNNASTILAGKYIELFSTKGDIVNTDIVDSKGNVKRALIQSVGSAIHGEAANIKNLGSVISAAGGDLYLKGAVYNISENSSTAEMYAKTAVTITNLVSDTGTIQGNSVKIGGHKITIGNPPLGSGPTKLPRPTIKLSNAFDLKGAGFTRGSGNVYEPGKDAASQGAVGADGKPLATAVDADGNPVTVEGPKVVGTVNFLYAVPFNTSEERNPSWIFAAVGADTANLTFFADPVAERILIQQALVQATGRAVLDPKYKDPKEQQQEFYRGTVEFLQAHGDIKLGDALTKAQRKKVTKPILWYSWKTIDGQQVLVPELILPEKDLKKYAYTLGQGMVLGEDIEIKADKVTNTGKILATDHLTILAKEFVNERAVVDGKLQTGGVLSAKDLYIETKKDIVNRGGMMLAGDSLVLKAGGNIRLETQQIVTTVAMNSGKSWGVASTVKNIGGIVSSGGTLSMEAKKTIHIVGSTVTSVGDMALVGKKGVTVEAAFDRVDLASGGQSSGFLTKKSYAANASVTTALSSLVSSTKGSVGIRTERGDIQVLGSNVSANDNITLLAGYDADGKAIKGSHASVVVSSVQATTDLSYQQKKSGFGLFFGDGGFDIYCKTSVAGTTSVGTNVASSLSTKHGDITVKATWDVTVKGSTVTAKEGAIAMKAARDLKVLPGADTASDSYEKKTSGVGIHVSGGKDGFSVAAGYSSATLRQGAAASVVAKSYLSAGQGITLRAGRDVTVVAAVIGAKGKVDIHGDRDTNILAGENRTYAYQSAKETFKGIRAEVRQNVTSAVRQIRQVPGLAGSGYGNAAYQAVAGLSAAMSLTDGLLSLSNPTLSASLTVGGSGKYSTAQAWSATAVPTTIKAGELSVTAGRDLHMVGTQAKVTGDLWLDAGRNILIESAQSTAGSSAHQSSWNAGIGWGGSCSAVNGCSGGLYAEGSYAQARNGTTSLTNQNANFDVGGHAHVGSGRDTTFRGVVLTAATADLDVKGNFTLESVQDTSHGAGSSSSFGASGTVGTTGFNGSVSFGGSTSSSDRAWVTEQSGIYTTNGDLNAHVGHNTTLIGSVMEAQGGKVNLDTQTLTMQDLQDHDVGTSAGGQVGLGYGEQQTGLGQQGSGSATFSGQVATYDIERATKAAIGEGTITVRDEAHSQTTAAEANRDTANTQVITRNERSGVQYYGSTTAIQEMASGFAGIQQNFKHLPENVRKGIDRIVGSGGLVGRTAEEAIGNVLAQLFNPKVARIGSALKNGELDYDYLAHSLGNCTQQQGFNLHDLLFTPAYAAGGCPVRLSTGEIVYLTKSEQDSCWYAAGQVALGVLRRSTGSDAITAATKGFAAGALEAAGSDLRALGNLGGYALALTYDSGDPRRQAAEQFFGGMRDQVVNMLAHPVDTLKGAATEFVNSVQDQSILYAQAAAQGDYVTMGRIEGELAYQVAAILVSGAASEALGKSTVTLIKAAVPSVADAARLGLGKFIPSDAKIIDAAIKWGGGIIEQGLPWEDYLAKLLPAGTRLPGTFKTFDFFDPVTGTATSAKTLDTLTAAKIAKPEQVYYSLKKNIDDVIAYKQTYIVKEARVDPNHINVRELQVAVPQGTTAAQWEQIQRAISYAQAGSPKVNVTVTVVK